MDIKLLPNITVIPVNNNRPQKKQPAKNMRVKGKVVHVRHSRSDESGKSVITIITDSHENQIKDIINSEVIVTTTD